MFGRVIAPIAQAGQAATGPTGVSIATSASGNYDNACLIYRVGMASVNFENGSNFSSAAVTAQCPYSSFMSDRDRTIAFGAYARATSSGGALSYTWTLTEDSAFPTGTFQSSVSENTAQDLRIVSTPTPPTGSPDTSTGIGPYVLFTGAPTNGDSGEYTLALSVTDSNGTTAATSLDIEVEFA